MRLTFKIPISLVDTFEYELAEDNTTHTAAQRQWTVEVISHSPYSFHSALSNNFQELSVDIRRQDVIYGGLR